MSEPKKLSPRHYAVMRELLAGTPPGVTAKIFGYTLGRLSVITHSKRFLEEMEKLRTKVNDKFSEVEGSRNNTIDAARSFLDKQIMPSLKKLTELRDAGESPEIQLRSSTALLDRAGVNKIEKIIVEGEMEVNDNLAFALTLVQQVKKNDTKKD